MTRWWMTDFRWKDGKMEGWKKAPCCVLALVLVHVLDSVLVLVHVLDSVLVLVLVLVPT